MLELQEIVLDLTHISQITVLGVGFFFLQTNFDFLTSNFWRNFFISFESHCCPELKFEKTFHLCLFFVKLWGFKDCHFDQRRFNPPDKSFQIGWTKLFCHNWFVTRNEIYLFVKWQLVKMANWSKWPKWQSSNPPDLRKMITRENIFSNLSSGQQ